MSATASPWGRIAPASHVALSAIQQEEADAALARQLQQREGGTAVSAPAASSSSSAAAASSAAARPTLSASAIAERMDEMDEAELAAAIAAAEAAATAAAASAAADVDDETLAALLQAEFDREHDQIITQMEKRQNMHGSHKIKVTMDSWRMTAPERQVVEAPEDSESEEEEDELTYDRTVRSHRDAEGSIVTKHNAKLCGRRNRRKMESFPLTFETGDLRHEDWKISNKIFNSLKKFSERSERSRARVHDKAEKSTNVLALDAKTRLILYRLVNAGILEAVHGCVSTGKESVIFHGVRRVEPDNPDNMTREEVAIKVFKTVVTEFKNRQQFMHGDRRYEARVGKQSTRKIVKIWAEKEMANLTRMQKAGILCPQVVVQRKHVLVMSFIGEDSTAAPKIKDVQLSAGKWQRAFEQVREAMRIMYHECMLVHGDLSEYNILFYKGKPWIIDVGQSVEPTHPRANEFLYRDCNNVAQFFNQYLDSPVTAAQLFEEVTSMVVSEAKEQDLIGRLRGMKPKNQFTEEYEETSGVVLDFPVVDSSNSDLLLDGIDDFELLDGEGDEEEEEEESGDDSAEDSAEEPVIVPRPGEASATGSPGGSSEDLASEYELIPRP